MPNESLAPQERTDRIASLRKMLRRFEQTAAEQARQPALPVGDDALDGLLPRGGFPCGGLTEVTGPEGGGRLSVALLAAAAATRSGRLVAVVDAPGQLYPPAAASLGVELSKLCVIRPPGGQRAAWAAEQLARSGCFALVVLSPLRRVTPVQGERLRRAAATGDAALVTLSAAEEGSRWALPTELRLAVRPTRDGTSKVSVLRARGAAPGGVAQVYAAGSRSKEERHDRRKAAPAARALRGPAKAARRAPVADAARSA